MHFQTDRRLVVIGDIHSMLSPLITHVHAAELETDDRPFFVFLGDLTDSDLRYQHPLGVLRFVMNLVRSGNAVHVLGNHDAKLLRALRSYRDHGSWNGQPKHGLDKTLEILLNQSDDVRNDIIDYLSGVPTHATTFREDKLHVFVHGALPVDGEDMLALVDVDSFHPKSSQFSTCIFGRVAGFDNGRPIRSYDWANTIPDNVHVHVGHDYNWMTNGMRFPNLHWHDYGVGKIRGAQFPNDPFII
ncbi:MAG: hypothetical protein D6698_15315 [Gammaproteobacteria bacterium]|nr:MAG: hypothetical protein D6698_15315 [Gammaproteobacteria bacterium]